MALSFSSQGSMDNPEFTWSNAFAIPLALAGHGGADFVLLINSESDGIKKRTCFDSRDCAIYKSNHRRGKYSVDLPISSSPKTPSPRMSTQETAQTLYLEANGTTYAYRIIGNRSDDSPPLLMLSHVRSTIDTWDPFVINNLTATGRQIITYDYAGLGHSGGSIAPSIRGFALNLLAFLDVLLPTIHTPHVDVSWLFHGRLYRPAAGPRLSRCGTQTGSCWHGSLVWVGSRP